MSYLEFDVEGKDNLLLSFLGLLFERRLHGFWAGVVVAAGRAAAVSWWRACSWGEVFSLRLLLVVGMKIG